jgi:hypothetical protein
MTNTLRTYELNEFQKKMISDIKSLPRKNLHYITAQQSDKHPNLTLPEMKKLIRRAIRRYIQEANLNYYSGLENELVKFYCVFETKKEFSLSQRSEKITNDEVSLGLHFHLFITCPDNYPWICFTSLSYQILRELSSLPKKKKCISKYGYFKIEDLNENFVQYHTKQQALTNREMTETNLPV